MFNTWFQVGLIPASGSAWSPNDVPLVRARTVSITVKLTYAAAATAGAKVHVYYSPNGKNWDTVAVDDFTVDFTAGQTVQKTYLVGIPEHGYMKVKVENLDSAQVITNVSVWYSIQSWFELRTASPRLVPAPEQEVGTIEKDVGESS